MPLRGESTYAGGRAQDKVLVQFLFFVIARFHPASADFFAALIFLVELIPHIRCKTVFLKYIAPAEHPRVALFFELGKELFFQGRLERGLRLVVSQILNAIAISLHIKQFFRGSFAKIELPILIVSLTALVK